MNQNKVLELQKLPFEQALEMLDATVRNMETGNLPLEKMMDAYEQGQVLATICEEKLKAVEKKIEILKNKTTNNTPPQWTNFETEPTRQQPAPAAQGELEF